VTKHTPGPWRFASDVNEVQTSDDYSAIAWIAPSTSSVAEYEANARLIAAAPELLSVLRMALGQTAIPATFPMWAAHAEIAIARVEGDKP